MARNVSLGEWTVYIPRAFQQRICTTHPGEELAYEADRFGCALCRAAWAAGTASTEPEPVAMELKTLSAGEHDRLIDVLRARAEQRARKGKRRAGLVGAYQGQLIAECVRNVRNYTVRDHDIAPGALCKACGVVHDSAPAIVEIKTGAQLARHGEPAIRDEVADAIVDASHLDAETGEA